MSEEGGTQTPQEKQPEQRTENKQKQRQQQTDYQEWKKLHGDMVAKMQIEKLYEALKRRNREQLEIAVREARAAGVDMAHEAFFLADRELEILGVKGDLQAAVATKDPERIQSMVEKISRTPMYVSRLQPEIADANRELCKIERLHRLQPVVLDMNRTTMGELRTYHHPPTAVKDVLKAVMLLFGYPEEYSEKWSNCQKQLQPNGQHGMNVRMLNYDIESVHPEIASRCSQILDEYPLAEVQEVSPGAATFYIWARGVLEEILPKSQIQVKPANKRRQRDLLPPPPPSGPNLKPPESPRRRRKAEGHPATTPRN